MSDSNEAGSGRSDGEPSPGGDAEPERRRQERIAAAVVTELVVAETPHMAMLHDFSSTGALILTRTKLEPGDRVELRIHMGEQLEETIVAVGAVVRVETWAEGQSFWPLSVAVAFDAPSEGHEERMRAIRRRQEELGIAP